MDGAWTGGGFKIAAFGLPQVDSTSSTGAAAAMTGTADAAGMTPAVALLRRLQRTPRLRPSPRVGMTATAGSAGGADPPWGEGASAPPKRGLGGSTPSAAGAVVGLSSCFRARAGTEGVKTRRASPPGSHAM